MKLHHIGIACQSMDEGRRGIAVAHPDIEFGDPVFDPLQQAHVCLGTLPDGNRFELVSGKPVLGVLEKGGTYYHVCFEVDDLTQELARMREAGGLIVSQPSPAVLFGGRKVAFIYMSYGLVELLEKS